MTSSVKSGTASAPADAAASAGMVEAVRCVAEETFFGYYNTADAAVFDAMLPHEKGEWLHVTVRFAGAIAGVATVMMPASLAVELLDALLGRAPGEPPVPAEVDDLGGEFGNMVCGVWLSRRDPKAEFTLAPPSVRRRPKPELPAREIAARAAGALNDRPVAVWITPDPGSKRA